jgi:hypothetical protein
MALYCYGSYSNYLLTQAPRVKLLSSIEMAPFCYLFHYPCSSGLLVSNKAFDKPSSGARTLGMGTLKESLQNVSENLGVVPTPLK